MLQLALCLARDQRRLWDCGRRVGTTPLSSLPRWALRRGLGGSVHSSRGPLRREHRGRAEPCRAVPGWAGGDSQGGFREAACPGAGGVRPKRPARLCASPH